MNAERLLEVYEQISEAPDAIERLRRFVLDLAVRGKLVEQDELDESASGMLLNLPELKEDLVNRTSLRKPKQLAATILDPEDDIPSGWDTVIGSDLFLTRSGNSKLIKGKQHSEPNSDLFRGFSAAGQDVWLEHWDHEGTAIILSAVGARCGKAFLTNGRWSAIANTHIVWLMPEITVPDFALLVLNNEDLWVRSGGAQPFVKVKETLARPFSLPPLAEQHRIVAKVDELMALCDRLEEARKTREKTRDKLTAASLARLTAPDTTPGDFPAHAAFALEALPALTTRLDQIKTLRQTILNLAVRGKLVQQDPADEPASKLLKRIERRRSELAAEDGIRKKKPVAPLADEDQLELPANWAADAFANLIDPRATISYGVLVPGPDVDEGIPFVRAQDLTLSDHPERPSKAIAPEVEAKYARTRLKGGEILLCVVGSIGKLGVAPQHWAGANIARAVARISPVDMLDRKYLLLFLRSDRAQGYFEEATRTLAQPTLNVGLIEKLPVPLPPLAQPTLNVGLIEKLPVPLPPLAEQHRIVAEVDALMTLCDRLETALTTTDTTRTRLLEALLDEALEPDTEVLEAAE